MKLGTLAKILVWAVGELILFGAFYDRADESSLITIFAASVVFLGVYLLGISLYRRYRGMLSASLAKEFRRKR